MGRFSKIRQLSRALTRPSSRDCVLGHKVLSRGWEWGLESLPLALSHKRHHLGVHRAGAQGVKSACNLQRLYWLPSSKFRLEGAKWVPQFWRGAGNTVLLRPTLRPAGRPPDSQPGARPVPGRGPKGHRGGRPRGLPPRSGGGAGGAGGAGRRALCCWCQALGQASRRGKVFRALARLCPAGLLYNNHHLSGSQAAGVSGEARMPRSAPSPGLRKVSSSRWGV